ncbi:MAG TPA: hypothetical protein PK573_10665 [Spirochaetota bacterium]|nr:hypothetical protein [Spirochaetota bacterium]HRZ25885.1 hypothetical protein [Spirochaetota bacterium]HSA14918.1 hypothetical protein [Spirochaetota bacterium]
MPVSSKAVIQRIEKLPDGFTRDDLLNAVAPAPSPKKKKKRASSART